MYPVSSIVVASTPTCTHRGASAGCHSLTRSGLTNREVAELFEQYGYLVHRRCLIILRSEALADDALQNAFIKVMRYGDHVRSADSPLRWLYRVADRCSFDLLRRSRKVELLSPDERVVDVPDMSMSVDVAARDSVLAFLNRLDDLDRHIAVLAFVDELSQDQIAAEVNRSRQTVNKRLGRIRERAQRFGEAHG